MMAATTITTNLQKPAVCAKAPETGPVAHWCIFCNGNGFTGFTIKEQKSDNNKLRMENKKLKKDIETLNHEMGQIISKMENFLDHVPLGNDQELKEKKLAAVFQTAMKMLRDK